MTTTKDDTDPFACFDDDSEQDISMDHLRDGFSNKEHHRNPDCGILTFHRGTEVALLTYVKNMVSQRPTSSDDEASGAVLRAVDSYCLGVHWMMHVGPKKAAVIKNFLQQAVESRSRSDPGFRLVELGTYCGYASIQMGTTLRKLGLPFHIYTVEVDLENVRVATELVRLARLEEHITILTRDLNRRDHLVHLLREDCQLDSIDFLLVDHDKQAYLNDLRALEQAMLIRRATHVAADNVVFHRIDSYCEYVQSLARRGVVKTGLVEGEIEYVVDSNDRDRGDVRDGIGTS